MPRKAQVPNFDRVVSIKIDEEQYQTLLAMARQYYIDRKIAFPSISEIVRYIITNYLKRRALELKRAQK